MDQASSLRKLIFQNQQNNGASTKIITVSSGKGGVGKSTFTVNFALELARTGKKVLIVDADIGMANIDIMLGCMTKKDSLLDLINPDTTVEDIVLAVSENLSLLSGGSDIAKFANLQENEVQLILDKIATYSENFDVILFDTGAGISDNVLNFLMIADEIFIITTPELTALTDAYVLIKAISYRLTEPKLSVVINRALSVQEAKDIFQRLNSISGNFLNLNLNLLGFIYEDVAVSKSIRNQEPIMLKEKEANIVQCFREITKNYLCLPLSNSGKKHSLKNFFEKLFRR
ncbi:P-loop NTPase [Succinispira mobilis]|uniref:P-loop NTPase n=1 Tax=Succinispira mobilis TaxID=78120 RepID=UPI00036D1D58|nr:P-loop NTPase [Succinispira mobilis]